MKIAHVVDSMDMGGAETLVAQMCRLQREQGHDPYIYALTGLGALGEQMLAEGFAIQPNVGRHLSNAARHFFHIFKNSRPNVVHLHNPTPTIYAAVPARLAGVRCIVSTRHSLVAKPRRLAEELKYAIAASCCNSVVGICDATAKNLREIHTVPSRKIVRVYNGAAALPRVSEDRWPPKTSFTLLYVGRLAPVKNHTLLLNAFRVAHSSLPCLRLWLVGDGDERERLEELASEFGIAEEVTFWGQQLEVAPFFSAADAFIMSSKSEGLPLSLLEAFSLGLPAIVTDVGGMAEVVRLARAGFTVSPSDPAEMAAAILRLAGSTNERKECSENAQATFQSRFTLPIMADAYMELYRNRT
jgi:glycosyltransferase involved in cell wall biosynthesis